MRFGAFAVLAGLVALAVDARAAEYTLVPLPRGFQLAPSGINNFGQIAGTVGTGNSPRAHLWTPSAPNGTDGSFINLGTPPGGTESTSFAINDRGQVAGYGPVSIGAGRSTRSFLWSPAAPNGTTGTMSLVGPTEVSSGPVSATAMNDAGQVLVRRNLQTILWTPNLPNGPTGANLELPPVPNDMFFAWDINNAGQIVGSGFDDALLWNRGTGGYVQAVPLGTLRPGDASSAAAINEAGQVVGSSGTGTEPGSRRHHAFLWTPATPNGAAGAMTDLGDLPGGEDYSVASAVNNNGLVVGRSSAADDFRAFLWTAETGMVDLNAQTISGGEGWLLTSANGVNDAGQIIGSGTFGGEVRTYLLTPVPEPTCAGLAACACAAAALRRRRR